MIRWFTKFASELSGEAVDGDHSFVVRPDRHRNRGLRFDFILVISLAAGSTCACRTASQRSTFGVNFNV
jgi:hypothetical protein